MATIPYDVADAFKRGRAKTRGSFRSTGDALYSYNLRIAHVDGGTIVIDVDWEEARRISATTARHIQAARAVIEGGLRP